MTIIRSIAVDDNYRERIATDLQEEISKIEKNENLSFSSFLCIGSGMRIKRETETRFPYDLEIPTKIFMVAFSDNS